MAETNEEPSISPQALRMGDAEAWRLAAAELGSLGHRVLASNLLCGASRQQDREDILQQALVNLTDKVIGGDNSASEWSAIRALFYTILRRRVIDLFRSEERIPPNAGEDALREIAAEEVSPEASASEQRITELVSSLPPPKPEVFRLHYFLGHTVDEIGDILGLSRGVVTSHLFRGRAALAKQIKSPPSEA